MNPFELLEKQCLRSHRVDLNQGNEPGEADAAADSVEETRTSDGGDGHCDEGEVIACFMYPEREPADYRSGEEESGTSDDGGARRSRSRSRERDELEQRYKNRDWEETDGTHLENSGEDEPGDGEQAAAGKTAKSRPYFYQMSAIDRMILRQEELLMRQSAKFLKEVKAQRDAE
ncbi:Na+/H+ antiporter [Babesia caballi]|uniref:Na+/H+ antiporter n=1 Tax=Babesia caballi TaxID=5871 RepID=A0AAV4M287_BABCB|nr:Na+/H+ antiporter [Babesia caballi]